MNRKYVEHTDAERQVMSPVKVPGFVAIMREKSGSTTRPVVCVSYLNEQDDWKP